MTCYHPLTAYQHKFRKTANGKALIEFSWKGKSVHEWDEIQLPCGQCRGCRLDRSRQWAIRCIHEASYYRENCFITLTFDNDHLDPNNSLVKRDFVLFMKKLRKYFDTHYGKKIRFFHCGEYGSLHQRPHHHAILFGADFDDKELLFINNGFPVYRSRKLEQLWPYGLSSVAGVSFESCAYVARYIMKKVNGDLAEEHYSGRVPEYVTMSRRPGIGYKWLIDHPEIYNYDQIVIRDDVKCKPPAYYDRIFDRLAPDFFKNVKSNRKAKAELVRLKNSVVGRLADKEKYNEIAVKRLIRPLEERI